MVLTMNTAERSWASDNCSISMVVEKDFNDFARFSVSRCDDDDYDDYAVSVVLAWGIGNISCHEAVKRRDYTCGRNSKCINSTSAFGYLSTCLPVYQGNPYLPIGCKGKESK
nr:wall-associated receptor kinase 1-like [Coffea arabica]